MTPGTGVTEATPVHVGIIMDGNGRWATARGLPRSVGHRRGADAVRRVVEAAPGLGVSTLTLYAFSGDNWQRPKGEVDALMAIFDDYLRGQVQQAVDAGIRLEIVGRRDRLTASLRRQVEIAESATAGGRVLRLRIAIDYSARDAIWLAAQAARDAGDDTRVGFEARLRSGCGVVSDAPDVDLLIRSGGEQRLSDFLLWECAYAELWFTDVAWPDFGGKELQLSLEAYARRERRFGKLTTA